VLSPLYSAHVWAANYGEGTYGVGVYNVGAVPATPSQSTGSSSSGNNGVTHTPGCDATVPAGTADLFQIDRTRTSAKLFFTPVMGSTANYHVIFGFKEGEERFGSLSEHVSQETNLGVQNITINHLNPGREYYFKVAPVNGCAVGTWSNWQKVGKSRGKLAIFYRYLPQPIRKVLGG